MRSRKIFFSLALVLLLSLIGMVLWRLYQGNRVISEGVIFHNRYAAWGLLLPMAGNCYFEAQYDVADGRLLYFWMHLVAMGSLTDSVELVAQWAGGW